MKHSNKKNVRLPVSTDIPSTYMFQPMGVLKEAEETRDWYYENFINICCDNWKNPRFLNVGNGALCLYSNVFEYSTCNYHDFPLNSIVNKLKSELNKGNYAFIYLEEYHIVAKNAYMSFHFRHQSLIYGYDDAEQVFNAIAFDKTGHYAELKYSYKEVKKAYIGGADCEDSLIIEPFGVIFFKVMPKFTHELSLINVINSLYDYINGSFPKDYKYTHSNLIQNKMIVPQYQTPEGPFGLNVVSEMIDMIQKQSSGIMSFGEFKSVHFLYEHAQMLLERIEYYKKFVTADAGYDSLISQCRNIVDRYQQARLLFLKMFTTNGHCENIIENQKSYIKRITTILNDLIPDEKIILRNVIGYLRKALNNRSIKESPLPYSKLKPNVDYSLSFDAKSNTKGFTKISFATPTRIKYLSLANIADYIIKTNGKICDSVYYKESASLYQYSFLKIEKDVSEIVIDATTELDLKFEDMQINVYADSIFYGKQAISSSVWENDDGSIKASHTADKAIDGSTNSFWRAKKQMESYDGTDWLEINLGSPRKLNTLVIGENDPYPRIKKYAISYTDGQAVTKELLVEDFKTGEKQVLTFPEICATTIRIKFIDCVPDSCGYAEPIIKLFEGYYSK